MSRPYKLLAVDLDGTLLDSTDRLPEENRAALHRAHEAGLIVCLTTGRCFSETRQVLQAIGLDLDVAVTVVGAIVSEVATGRTLHAEPIKPAALERVCRYLTERGLSFLLQHDGANCDVDYSVVRRRRWNASYDRWFEVLGCLGRVVEDWADLSEAVYRVTLIETPEFFKTFEPQAVKALPPELVNSNAIYVPPYGVHVLEFVDPQVNKWFGLERVCAARGIRAEEVVAIGDAINDLAMIREAGVSFAMDNADERIKRLATHVTSSNDQAGAAQAINQVLQRCARPDA